MSFSRGITVLFMSFGIMCAGPAAAETGSFTSVSSMTGGYTAIAHMDGTIFGGASEGTSTVVRSSGGPFVEGGSSRVTCIVHGKGSAAGTELEAACTVTAPSGDKQFWNSRRSAGDVAQGGGGAGRLEMLGGTGRFEGVTGSCSYQADYLTNELVPAREPPLRQTPAPNSPGLTAGNRLI